MGTRVASTGESSEGKSRAAKILYAVILIIAALLLVFSLKQPYWRLVLYAPQYPDGLKAVTYLTHLAGDIGEINELNHYIGMMKLEKAGSFEKAMAPYFVYAVAGLTAISFLFRGRFMWLLRLPAVLFPFGVVADLWFWLWYAGSNLDPKAALSSSIKPFTPMILGEGKIGQFRTVASFELGFWLASAAALLIVLTLIDPFHGEDTEET